MSKASDIHSSRQFAAVHGDRRATALPIGAFVNSASFWYPTFVTNSAWLDHAPFAFWITSILKPCTLVELGTHRGFSYFAFCQAIKALGLETRSYAIDVWKGEEHAGSRGEEIFGSVSIHNELHYAAFSQLVRSTFDDASSYFSPGSIDLLHIDGQHFYEDVKHHFDTWRPKLSDRAVVLFHDTNVLERRFGVHKFWKELEAANLNFEFLHGNGLGVLGYGGDMPEEIAALLQMTADTAKTHGVRSAYARLGAAIRADFIHMASKAVEVAEKLERAHEPVVRLEASEAKARTLAEELQAEQERTRELAGHLRELLSSTSWRITAPLRGVMRAVRWAGRKMHRGFGVDQCKERRSTYVRAAESACERNDWPGAIKLWSDIQERFGCDDDLTALAKFNLSIARRINALEAYGEAIGLYLSRKSQKQDNDLKIAVYTAITGAYDSLKLPEQLDARFDYLLFTDAPVGDTGIFCIRPIPYYSFDPTRTARFVKTHPHMLLPDYDIAIWLDANVLIVGDIYPLIEDLLVSGRPLAAFPHPLRTTLEEELQACTQRAKDDAETMKAQVEQYRRAGYRCKDLIESNLMLFDLRSEVLPPFLDAWWTEIDRHSRRDQLSLNYALEKTGVRWQALSKPPDSTRNHPALALVKHAHAGPAHTLIAALGVPMVNPSSGPSFADIKEQRVAAQCTRRIDIVVCVYNALEDVKVCLHSIAQNRDSECQRLIIVDDGSDEPTANYLRDYTSAAPWVCLLRNDAPRGYTRAANQGLGATTGELVILLNSDTIVTNGWAEKMADAVFSTPGAGLVGPLSNAASHQSIPSPDGTNGQTAINNLPPGMTPENLNRFCEIWTVAGIIPRVPLVHGFCLGITRAVIERIGMFSEEHFPNGYGEENDYCFRATDAGFSLVVATHTFVYHAKSKSYGPERLKLAQAGTAKLRELHGRPRIDRAVRSMRENPVLDTFRGKAAALYTRSCRALG